MATLVLAHGAFDSFQHSLSSPALRAWLGEDWAILFSHANDFVSYDLEMDRWVVITRRAFADRHIRPIALGVRGCADGARSWVTQVSGDERTVLLEDPRREHFGPVDLQTPMLREQIEQAGRRFVMIIDNALRVQKKFCYDSLSNLPSPLELLGWAGALRAKQLAKQAANAKTGQRVAPEAALHARVQIAARARSETPVHAAPRPATHAPSEMPVHAPWQSATRQVSEAPWRAAS